MARNSWMLLPGAAAAAFLAVPRPASAEIFYPNISGNVAIEIQGDFVARSDAGSSAKGHDVFTKTEPFIKLSFTEELSLNTLFVLEPMTVREPNENRVFEDEGIFVEELHLDYESQHFSVVAGKFTPNFGTAWDAAPGIYGTDMAEDYELAERLGFGGAVRIGNDRIGKHSVSASIFTLDTLIHDSLGKSRGTLAIDDGGPGNTEKLNSWGVALDGTVGTIETLTYHLGFVDQAKPYVGGGKNELGFVAGLQGNFDLGGGFGLFAIVEAVRFENADNVDDQERTYVTGAAQMTYGGWNLTLSHTTRITDTPVLGEQDFTDTQTQVSAGYAFDFGLTMDVGWKRENVAKVSADIFGFLLTYGFDFGPFPEQ